MKKIMIMLVVIFAVCSCSRTITEPNSRTNDNRQTGSIRVCLEISYEANGQVYVENYYYRHVDFVSMDNDTGNIIITKIDPSVGEISYFFHMSNLTKIEMKSEFNDLEE